MSATFGYSRRTNPSRKSYYAPPLACAGFDPTGQDCTNPASFDGFCHEHKGLKFWSSTSVPSIRERRLHANEGRCCGIAASTGCLCNRKINGCTFCHSHRDQRPPTKFFRDYKAYFSRSDWGLELTTRNAIVKENLMVFCQIYDEWSLASREARRRAERDFDEKKKAAEEAQRAWEEEKDRVFRDWTDRRRREELDARAKESRRKEEEARAAEDERKRAEAQRERLRREHERQKAAEEERQRKFQREEAERRRKEEARQKNEADEAKAKRMKERKNAEAIFNEYCRLCVEFDKTRFSDMRRASFQAIPWPVLVSPSNITPSHVNCQSIRDFFIFVKDIKGFPEQRRLLRETRNRYHPDRWASRNVILSVATERESIHVKTTGLVVSQEVNRLFDASN